jgi:hypothetical protein
LIGARLPAAAPPSRPPFHLLAAPLNPRANITTVAPRKGSALHPRHLAELRSGRALTNLKASATAALNRPLRRDG